MNTTVENQAKIRPVYPGGNVAKKFGFEYKLKSSAKVAVFTFLKVAIILMIYPGKRTSSVHCAISVLNVQNTASTPRKRKNCQWIKHIVAREIKIGFVRKTKNFVGAFIRF